MNLQNINDSVVFNENSFTKKIVYKDDKVLIFVLNFKVDQALPPHKHEESTVSLLVLSGAGEIRINDEVKELVQGMFLTAKGQDDFEIPRVTKDLSVLVTISPIPANDIYAKER
ncbi:cupin domain-containing protein [Alkalibaculum sp. M08DMB]|uniref:Cupin domain-containing protein n=1 Tax=Alkalibaculum sporogenes TaxID=2655001 RepID=A0A6A7K9W9_9FIRM|nr:cupin domain-containing protein [Alkalibaculum sporogenes]MPW26172.1 cupin domain-containing protein [Alkalibaculum sporogenes]